MAFYFRLLTFRGYIYIRFRMLKFNRLFFFMYPSLVKIFNQEPLCKYFRRGLFMTKSFEIDFMIFLKVIYLFHEVLWIFFILVIL